MRKSIEFYCDAYDRFQELRNTTGVNEMARILDVDPTTISAWGRGRSPYTQYSREHRAQLKEAKDMLEEGYSYVTVGRILSLRTRMLRRHFPEMGANDKDVDFSLDNYV